MTNSIANELNAETLITESRLPAKPSFLPIASIDRLWGVTADSLDVLHANPRRMAIDLLRLFLAVGIPITLWGPVGARKTRSIQALAAETDENGVPYQVITIQPSTEDPTVIHGMMFTSLGDDGVTTVMKRSLPSVVDQILKYNEATGGLTILFLDELTTCMPAQQHALLGLMTHGVYGDKDISPYISIAMAANPEGTVSTVNELGEQVINRSGHIAWYGDVTLFLEEWSSGFGTPANKPGNKVSWFIQTLLNQSPEEAFRKPGNWDIDTLVPFELMEHTERAVTELARLIDFINTIMVDVPDEIRKSYIVECTRALLGNTWAERAAVVTELESNFLTPESLIEKSQRLGFTLDTTTDELSDISLNSDHELYRLSDNSLMRQDEIATLLDATIDKITEHGFSLSTYIAAWAFAVSAPTSGQIMGNHAGMLRLLRIAQTSVQGGILENTNAVPAFVSPEVRESLRSAMSND